MWVGQQADQLVLSATADGRKYPRVKLLRGCILKQEINRGCHQQFFPRNVSHQNEDTRSPRDTSKNLYIGTLYANSKSQPTHLGGIKGLWFIQTLGKLPNNFEMQRLISRVKVQIAEAFGGGQGPGAEGGVLFPDLHGGDMDTFASGEFFTSCTSVVHIFMTNLSTFQYGSYTMANFTKIICLCSMAIKILKLFSKSVVPNLFMEDNFSTDGSRGMVSG